MMGEDFPIAVTVGRLDLLADVFGGHRCVIQYYLVYSVQSLGFAALWYGAYPYEEALGMVLSGHWVEIPPPVNSRVYSPTSYYPFRKNQIGVIHHVGGDLSDASWMQAGYEGPNRIKPGVQHYGNQRSVSGWAEPAPGSTVYKTGMASGTTHGELVGYGWVWHPQHETWLLVGASDFDADPGDSGAPVYVIGPGYALISGTIIGQFTFEINGEQELLRVFSPISLVLGELNVGILLGP